ncbi:MAG: nodulation protein NfeD [Elusimicrobia bacterium]|nr:nodulation protein NfeD [Elusimicrobiota bacterium]
MMIAMESNGKAVAKESFRERRRVGCYLLLSFATTFLLLSVAEAGQKVLVATYSGIISPPAAEFLSEAIQRAEREDFEALIIELDTPGGLDLSMREVVKSVMGSDVPVIVYVSPSGARAASAGVFITMAAHVAAMAPGTNIGAAHPVMLGGVPPLKPGEKKEPSPLEDKVINDAAAYLKSIAQRRNRNEGWTLAAVSRSSSTTAEEAVRNRIVDLVAENLQDLLLRVDGRRIPEMNRILKTQGAGIVRLEMSRRQRWLTAITDPNVAMILMSLGAAGLFLELYNPGLILPGVVGGVSLILGFYSLHTLSANYAGILLILLGFVLFLLEIKVVSYGILTIGGAISFLLGTLILFDKSVTGGVALSWRIVSSTLLGMVGFTFLCAVLYYRASHLKSKVGSEALIGIEGITKTDLNPEGKVLVMGELWNAQSLQGLIPSESKVVVAEVRGLTLKVRRHPTTA